MLKTFGVLAAAVLVAVTVTVVPASGAPAASGTPLPADNACANPTLDTKSTGWSTKSGGTGSRVAVTDHVAASYARQTVTTAATVVVNLPQLAVAAGQRWTFGADSRITPGGSVRVAVQWYDAASTLLSRVDGSAATMSSTTWLPASVTATAPSGATVALVTETAQVAVGATWLSTACSYTSATTTTPPPSDPGDGTQAATLLAWGSPVGGDEFSGTKLDTAQWGPYSGSGHAGKGKRSPAQISVSGGLMTISGTSSGTTGGMASRTAHKYGRWETRMRVPRGDARYHPVVILWPAAEDWPVGGEVDYAETTAASTSVQFFLHYSSSNKQTTASRTVDLTQWHNYAVDWSSKGIKGYVDGMLFFTDTTSSHLPPRAMQQTIQLDWFPSGSSATKASSMQVDWTRYYAP